MKAGEKLNRRRFLSAVAALGVAARGAREAASEPPPETTTLRIFYPGLCMSPVFAAETLLRAEGFTDVQYRRDQPTGRSPGAPSRRAKRTSPWPSAVRYWFRSNGVTRS